MKKFLDIIYLECHYNPERISEKITVEKLKLREFKWHH